jgi:quercetin dioxygenase-like cupin family protein
LHFYPAAEQLSVPVSHNPELSKNLILANGVVPKLTNFSTVRIAPGKSVAPHSHRDMYEIFWVSEGAANALVASRLLVLTAGDCLVVEPGEDHQIKNCGAQDLVFVYFGIAV